MVWNVQFSSPSCRVDRRGAHIYLGLYMQTRVRGWKSRPFQQALPCSVRYCCTDWFLVPGCLSLSPPLHSLNAASPIQLPRQVVNHVDM